jgi:type IV pilus assembly protein PilV
MLKIKKSNGYLMIEVLIATLVFAMVSATLLLLQIKTTGSSSNSSNRTMAVAYANELADKMRANRNGAISGYYNAGVKANNSCKVVNYSTVSSSVSSCTTQQMAQDDLMETNSSVTNTLPAGNFVVCLDSAKSLGTPTAPNCDGAGSEYVIKIFWKDSSSKLLGINSGYAQATVGVQL